MLNRLRKRPVLSVILIVLCLVIVFAIFSPRNGSLAGFNVNANLGYFDNIIPCGIKGKAVTSMHAELGSKVDELEVKQKILKHFQSLFEAKIIPLR